MTVDILLRQAERVLERRDLTALLPYAEALEPFASTPGDGQAVFEFFSRLAQTVLFSPELHISLFAHCLDALCAYDPVEGAAILENMLEFANSVEKADSTSVGILH